MRKAHKFTLLTLITILLVFVLLGCGKKEDNISSVSLKDYDPNTAIEMAVGNFDYNAYTVVVTHESGATEEIPLTEDMIAEEDIFKLYQVGEHDITFNYDKHKYTFRVSIKRMVFEGLAFPEKNVFTYDGKEHTVEVDGNIPANAVVTYIGGNSFLNAGTYDVTAVVSCEGYVTEKLSTTVKIERAKYDMSGVKFEGKEVVYDGNVHSLAISGTLPEGVSAPIYTINEKTTSSATDVGEYKVKATFVNNNPNYEAIPEMEAMLKIIPAEYTVKGVDIVFRNEDGIIISDATKIYDGKSVKFDLNDYNKLSKNITVSFSVRDKNGNVISDSNKVTNIINAGVYTVTAEFILAGGKNYKPIEPLVRTFEIFKTEHPGIQDIRFLSAQTTYDGNEHSIEIEGTLPEGVTVSYEYYRGNTLIVDTDGNPVQSVIDAGIYTVKAVFMHPDENLGKIEEMVATFNIQKATLSIHIIGFSNENSVIYSAQPYEPKFITWKEITGLDYDVLQYSKVKYYVYDSNSAKYVEMAENELPTEVGSYRASIDVSIADEYKHRYEFEDKNEVQTIVKQFDILKRKVEAPNVEFTSESKTVYNGDVKQIKYTATGNLELITVSTAYFKYVSGEYIVMKNGELPVNKGLYKFVVTLSVSDSNSCVFDSGENSKQFSFEFEIVPATIDISGISLDYTVTTFNEKNQLPTLLNVPAHVKTTVNFYLNNGIAPIVEAINAGKYRCEVIIAPQTSNYVLSSDQKLVFEFEILPVAIDVSDLTFGTLEFIYNKNNQLPSLEGLPAHVKQIVRLYSITYETVEIANDQAINAGKYRCDVTLSSENSNYILSGNTKYSTEFKISPKILANLDDLTKMEFEITCGEGTYTDDILANVINKTLFGDMSGEVQCRVGSIYSVNEEKYVGAENIVAGETYTINCRIDIIDYNYALWSDERGAYVYGIEKGFSFNFI